jgi:hypothetical protein
MSKVIPPCLPEDGRPYTTPEVAALIRANAADPPLPGLALLEIIECGLRELAEPAHASPRLSAIKRQLKPQSESA